MANAKVENVYFDENRKLTYVVMAAKTLTDGELFSAIRLELLKRGGKLPESGQTIIIGQAK